MVITGIPSGPSKIEIQNAIFNSLFMEFVFKANGEYRVLFFSMMYYSRQRTVCCYYTGLAETPSFCYWLYKLHQLYTGVHEQHLAIQLFWVTAKLFATRISPIYLVDKAIFLFLVLLKEMRLLDEYTILYFLFLVVIKGMRMCGESKISCVTSGLEKFSWDLLRVEGCNSVYVECFQMIK